MNRQSTIKQAVYKHCVFLLLFFLGSTQLIAQKYSFTSFSIKDGLPNSSISVLYQDSRGLIWIGSQGGGLCQYDGYNFYPLEIDDASKTTNIFDIAEDTLGRIWFSADSGLFIFDGEKLSQPITYNETGKIGKLFCEKSGLIWLLTKDKGALRVNPASQVKIIEKYGIESGLKSNHYIDIEEDLFGRFWLVSDSNLTILDPAQEMNTIDLGLKYAIPPVKITAIDAASSSEIWIGTANKGVILLSYDSLSCYEKRSYNSYFYDIDDNILSVTVDKSDNVWIGTDDNGLIYIDYPFVKILAAENGLESNMVTDILEDSEGNVWFGTQNSGVKLFAGWQFIHYDSKSGLPDNAISSIAQDRSGNYWCTGSLGLYRFARDNDRLEYVQNVMLDDFENVDINRILFLTGNNIIFGTASDGILLIRDNKVYHYNETQGLAGNEVNCLYADTSKIWIGTGKGLSLLTKDTLMDLTHKQASLANGVNAIVQDKKGNVYLGSNNGIVVLKGEEVLRFGKANNLMHVRINSLVLDEKNNLFVGTLGGGIYTCSVDNISGNTLFKTFAGDGKLLSDNVFSMAKFKDTLLVVGTDKGANIIEIEYDSIPLVSAIHSYDNSNGFLNTECNPNAILVDQSSYVWFGTKSGLTCYDRQREQKYHKKPRIYLTGLEVNFEAVKWQSKDDGPDEWYSFPKNLKLKHNENYLNFSFSGVYFSEGLQYQYFLEGLNRDWSNPSLERTEDFSKLSPGKYNFRVRAVTKSGLISDEQSFAFRIKPPFWRTWWFTLLFFAAIIYLVIWYIRYREQKLKHDKEVLEETVKQRTQEIREQKTHIEQQKQELTDSIEYAKRIQDAVISQPTGIEKYLSDYFIMFLPRDIVSGDFYWFGEYDNKFIFSVADCTGHGVPGAFMSMLGIRLLNEIVLERGVTAPNEILDQLRDGVIHALKQEGKESTTKDGMDMALCTIDKSKGKLYFSGAYNALWLIRGDEVLTYKADRMPVAIYFKLNDFTCHEIDCQPGDQLYLFSDGFPDQFGGPEQKKYMSKKLRENLLSISHLPMDQQREYLLKEFYEWKGDSEQIDDVSLMGVKI
ncbi:MAG: SpoIIE family protein phosphatase [Bacteroidales bacterium]|nr:SpoIIE family protein phosphatase [Bacteroidales bacterium]MBN2817957.1 SpoIIE family protein phosphatase [Bacteroidales bacterium]